MSPQMLLNDLWILCDSSQVKSMQWNLLVACVVSLHFCNIVFTCLQVSRRGEWGCLASVCRYLSCLDTLVSRFLMLLGAALVAVGALVTKTIYTPHICTYKRSRLSTPESLLFLFLFICNHASVFFRLTVVMVTKLIFICHLDSVPHFFFQC